MADYTKEEIARILQTSEILKRKDSAFKINISAFCKEAIISRKNAYKHKKNYDLSIKSRKDKVKELEAANEQLEHKLQLAEVRARDADLYWELRNILVALNTDSKKKGSGQTPQRLRLINAYNKISNSLGLEPLSSWKSTEDG